ncbi:MAG TPA: NAD(P)H-dependent oxidoreductase subunit E [Thermoleophilaceae bacterium]|nr:NAD(P)H-dependent oxidoreductase subunit E [Thermoleophilaceae bacterium]
MADGRNPSVTGTPATSGAAEEVRDEGAVRATALPPGWDEAVDLDADPATVPDPSEVDVPDSLRSEIDRLMRLYPDRHSATLPALGAAQRVHGWCSPEALRQVAAVMQVTPAYLSSVATFYDMLRTEPLGSRYVYVCTSVACHLRNARRVYQALAEEAESQGLEDVDLREFECLGACDMAPMASFDGRFVGPLSTEDAAEVVGQLKGGREVLPGRGLGDDGFRLPETAPPTEGEPAHPKHEPAGGDWPDAPEQAPPPAEGPPPHRRAIPEPFGPGTSHAGAELDPLTRETRAEDEEDEE